MAKYARTCTEDEEFQSGFPSCRPPLLYFPDNATFNSVDFSCSRTRSFSLFLFLVVSCTSKAPDMSASVLLDERTNTPPTFCTTFSSLRPLSPSLAKYLRATKHLLTTHKPLYSYDSPTLLLYTSLFNPRSSTLKTDANKHVVQEEKKTATRNKRFHFFQHDNLCKILFLFFVTIKKNGFRFTILIQCQTFFRFQHF